MAKPFIEQITLTNFKCYKSLTVPLKQGINIIYGVNGTGKTTLLEAIGIAAGRLFMRFPAIHNIEQRAIRQREVRLETPEGMRYPEFQFPVSVQANGTVLSTFIEWTAPLPSFEGGTTRIEAEEMARISDEVLTIAQNGRKDILPIIAYFSTNRLFTIRKETEKQPIGRFLGYFNALNESSIRKHIRTWFKDADYLQFQRRQTDEKYTDIGLQSIKKLVIDCVGENWKDFYYFEPETEPRLEKGLFIVKNDGEILPELWLSDGYRNFLWLLMEIAWRCYMLNPFLADEAAAKTNGIVLIDEVDLHLHPKWQQTVLNILAKAFPSIQFVVTTHSPNVLASVKAAQVILLAENSATPLEAHIHGSDPVYIMERFMRVDKHEPSLREPIKLYFELLNAGKGRSDEAKKLRAQLEQEMDSQDPMFYEADTLIDFLSDDSTEE